VTTNHSPGDKVITLKSTHVDGYHIYLGVDIIPDSIPIKVESIQFHLCTEDIKFILNPENMIKLPETVKSSLQTHLTNLGDTVIERRSWSLLGNDIINQIAMIKLKRVVLLCQMDSFVLTTWRALLALEEKVKGMSYLDIPSAENEELHEITDEFVSDNDFDYSEFASGML
jgi:hypothetical protein